MYCNHSRRFPTLYTQQKYNMVLLEDLQWRYATKKMSGQAVESKDVNLILEAIRLSPSSSGLQPYRVWVISSSELKEKISPIAYNQSQVMDASHVLIFAAWDTYTEERVNGVFARSNGERGLPDSATDAYRTNLLATFGKMTSEEQFHHAAKQAYIALGIAMVAAAQLKVDATPMEGFNAAGLDELLDLRAQGLRSVALLPLGYRDPAGDWLVNLKKVRTPEAEFFKFL